MIFTNLYASSWSTVGKPKEKGLFDFDFITWMAWTWPTASFFIFIAACITVMSVSYTHLTLPTKRIV